MDAWWEEQELGWQGNNQHKKIRTFFKILSEKEQTEHKFVLSTRKKWDERAEKYSYGHSTGRNFICGLEHDARMGDSKETQSMIKKLVWLMSVTPEQLYPR